MKTVSRRMRRSRSRATSTGVQSNTFKLSQAKTFLGRLLAKAEAGEEVYITRGSTRFILQQIPEIDPIPMRPPGYFSNMDTKAEIAEFNELAKASSKAAPRDIE